MMIFIKQSLIFYLELRFKIFNWEARNTVTPSDKNHMKEEFLQDKTHIDSVFLIRKGEKLEIKNENRR